MRNGGALKRTTITYDEAGTLQARQIRTNSDRAARRPPPCWLPLPVPNLNCRHAALRHDLGRADYCQPPRRPRRRRIGRFPHIVHRAAPDAALSMVGRAGRNDPDRRIPAIGGLRRGAAAPSPRRQAHHRQDARQLPVPGRDPHGAAGRAHRPRHARSARLLPVVLLETVLGGTTELHLRPWRTGPLLPQICATDGALARRAAARPLPRRPL